MENLFSGTGQADIVARINKLNPQSVSQWGKMNVGQMLHHCQKPLEIPMGGATFKANFLMRFIGGIIKKKVLKQGVPFSKNSPTGPGFKIEDERDFETEKTELLSILNRFIYAGKMNTLQGRHPFFGPMNNREWEIMQWKHLDHHLRQFGV